VLLEVRARRVDAVIFDLPPCMTDHAYRLNHPVILSHLVFGATVADVLHDTLVMTSMLERNSMARAEREEV
jgi:hypothetical protein